MEFVSVELKNFLSHKDTKVPLKGAGLTLIEGDNGAGKSSMLDAVSWCLFAKTVRGIKDDGVVHNKFKSNTQVTVVLKKRNYQYTITRYRKHDEFKNRLMYEKRGLVTRDIIKVEEGTIDATQDKLIQDLGIDFDLFKCTVLFGQEDTFNFVNETNSKQKEILSKIMRVDFTKYLAEAKAEKKRSGDRLIEIDRKLAVLRSHEGDPEEMYGDDRAEWETDHKASLELIRAEIKDMKACIAATEDRIAACDPVKLQALKTKIKAKLDLLEQQRDGLGLDDKSAAILTLDGEIARNKKLAKAGKCSMCETVVDGAKTAKLLKTLESDRTAAMASLTAAKLALATIKTDKEKYAEKLESLNEKLTEAATDAETLRLEQEGLAEARGRLKADEAEVNPWLVKIKEAAAKQAEIRFKIGEFETEETELKQKEPYLDFWIKAFGDNGIKSFLFDLICSTLTEKSNNYLNVLTGGDIQVTFDTQKKLKSGELRESFDCEVILDGTKMPYVNYSGGQKTRISLAVDMALSDLMSDQYGEKFNIVCFDEQTTYMNEKGRRRFMTLLQKISVNRGVYVIDHDAEFKAQFDDVITVKIKNGVSKIC